MKILILGITGMLGNTLFRFFSQNSNFKIYGTIRGAKVPAWVPANNTERVINNIDVENHDSLIRVFAEIRPDVIINCVGLVKQLSEVNDPLQAIPLNTMLPHRLALLSKAVGGRLIHISTDCVFSGLKGNYLENDFPDASDLYGRSKLLGEINDSSNLTIRTSIIGHELASNRSLINWFLTQEGKVQGYTKAIYSGLPTIELANIIFKYILPNSQISGLYHIASTPISKYELLNLVKDIYSKEIEIEPSDKVVINRSLNAQRFNKETGYVCPNWRELIQKMHAFK